jgi:hypothetical protein
VRHVSQAELFGVKSHWLRANTEARDVPISEMDRLLHEERLDRRSDGDWLRTLGELPAGVMVNWKEEVHLWTGTALRRREPTGYGPKVEVDDSRFQVVLVTPPSVVRAIAAGYAVQMHTSVQAKRRHPNTFRPDLPDCIDIDWDDSTCVTYNPTKAKAWGTSSSRK